MKTITISLLGFLGILTAHAQNNQISVGFQSYHYYNVLGYGRSTLPVELTKIEYGRKISQIYSLRINYTFSSGLWTGELGSALMTDEGIMIGKIENRLKYHFFSSMLN